MDDLIIRVKENPLEDVKMRLDDAEYIFDPKSATWKINMKVA
jgi:hypothetical protein